MDARSASEVGLANQHDSQWPNDSGPLSQKSAGHMQDRKINTNPNPSPDPNRYRRSCPDSWP